MPSEDDPYAKYLTKPADAAPAPADDDPYAKYLTKPGDAATAAPVDDKRAAIAESLRNPLGVVSKFANAVTDDATAGLGDTIHSALPNAPDAATLRGRTQQDRTDLGTTGNLAASLIGYGMGPGKVISGLGIGEGAASAAAPALSSVLSPGNAVRAGRAIQGGVDTALASGMGSLGHGEGADNAITSSVGGLLLGGAVGGALGGQSRNFAPRSTIAPRAADDLSAESKAGYDTMKAAPVNPKTVGDALQQSYSSLKPDDLTGLSFRFKNQFINIQNAIADLETTGEPTSISAVDRWQRQLWKAANKGQGDADSTAAARVGDALQSIIDSQGMTSVQSAAKLASARAKDMAALEAANAASAPALAAKMLNKRGQLYGANAQEALRNLAGLGPQPTMAGGLGSDIKKATASDLATNKGIGALALDMRAAFREERFFFLRRRRE